MLMDLRPPADRRRLATRRSRVLRLMLAGSLLIHVLAILAIWLLQPEPPSANATDLSAEVAMVFESPGAKEASVQAPSATQERAVPAGNLNATTTQPDPDTTPPPQVSSPPALSSTPPVVPELLPPAPEPPAPSTPQARVPEPPMEQQPQFQPASSPPVPRPPPTVTLSQDTESFLPPPRFVMPQPPPPLPPLLPPRPSAPRPVQPRQYARPSPSNPFGAPQDWSLNTGPSSQQPGRPSRGFDLSTAPFSAQSESSFSYAGGARPTGDWLGAFRRWAQARVYYPEQAARDGQDGVATVALEIDRSGRVLSVQLIKSAGSPFLNGGLIDVFRNATVPPVTSDMPGATTFMHVQLTYHLIRR